MLDLPKSLELVVVCIITTANDRAIVCATFKPRMTCCIRHTSHETYSFTSMSESYKRVLTKWLTCVTSITQNHIWRPAILNQYTSLYSINLRNPLLGTKTLRLWWRLSTMQVNVMCSLENSFHLKSGITNWTRQDYCVRT